VETPLDTSADALVERPTLETARLVLRPFTVADAPDIERLAADRDIASTTRSIPHPYPAGTAVRWIARHAENFAQGRFVNFAIVRHADHTLVGSIGLGFHLEDDRAEMGYWIGKPYWNQGYTTEAAIAVLGYGFAQRGLHRIYAEHLTRNPASGRVMQKIGMQHEAHLREHMKKWGVYEDLEVYGILRSEYEAQQASTA
jgi:ribosomal-protein-alanine N-acetyltransferase